MKWIKLHYPGGEPVLVNSDMIEQVSGCEEGSKVFYPVMDGYGQPDFIAVRESFEEIEAMLMGER